MLSDWPAFQLICFCGTNLNSGRFGSDASAVFLINIILHVILLINRKQLKGETRETTYILTKQTSSFDPKRPTPPGSTLSTYTLTISPLDIFSFMSKKTVLTQHRIAWAGKLAKFESSPQISLMSFNSLMP